MAKAKRGRPRKTYHGPDKGTPQVQEKRRMMAGAKGNPEKAWTWLGAMKEHGFITQAQHDAAARYAELRAWYIGRPDVLIPSNAGQGGGNSDGTDPREIAQARAYDAARRALANAGSRAKTQVDNLAVFNRPPSCLVVLRRGRKETPKLAMQVDTAAKDRDHKALIDGLNAMIPKAERRAVAA